MSTPTPMVFLVDDDNAVRRALTRLIQSAGYRVEGFASAHEFLEFNARAHAIACLILDVRLPGLNGLELQRQLNTERASLPIIFITGHGDISMTVSAMKAGATDFLAKPICDTDLLRSIETALQRSSEALASRIELDSIYGRLARLTLREREVLALLFEGRVNKQVAFELGVCEKTIKVHRAHVMEKMEARSLVDLVRGIEKAGIPLLPNQFPTR